MTDNAVLTVEEMYRADQAAVAAGVPSLDLMEAAGTAIADEIRQRWEPQPLAVLCGPGNNGGDGFVVARLMADHGWPVKVSLLGARDRLKGDAAVNAGRWSGDVQPLEAGQSLDGCGVVVDALFGAGLARDLEGAALEAVEAIDRRGLDCVAVDTPSGIHGDTGAVLGAATRCRVTVTFFRPKPGHLLMPGRDHCGDVVVADIGIPDDVLADIAPQTFANGPALWRARFPRPGAATNKYHRGHAVILGGQEMTGAARLAALAARRVGAGLVTLAVPPSQFPVYAAGQPGTLVKPVTNNWEFGEFLSDPRRNAVLLGPGAGVSERTRRRVLTALRKHKACVIDADGLTVFEGHPDGMFGEIAAPCLLTPHEGEFARLFSVDGDKLSRARHAAQRSGAVVLLKGADTVIAAPDGRAVVNTLAPPGLATGGTGDVLAGFALGLMAQGMDAFDAGCAAAWLHGAAAESFGPGLIAEDLSDMLPGVLRRLFDEPENRS